MYIYTIQSIKRRLSQQIKRVPLTTQLISWNNIKKKVGMGAIALLNTQYFHVRFLQSQQGRYIPFLKPSLK